MAYNSVNAFIYQLNNGSGYYPNHWPQTYSAPIFDSLAYSGSSNTYSTMPNQYNSTMPIEPLADLPSASSTASVSDNTSVELNESQNNPPKAKVSDDDREVLLEYESENKKKTNIAAEGSIVGTMAFSSIFAAKPIITACKTKQNKEIKDMFFAYNERDNKAKYENLYKKAPVEMQRAQEEMVKAKQQCEKELKRLYKKGVTNKKLKKVEDDYKALTEIMKKALKTGNPEEVAKATEKIRVANNTKYKNLGSSTKSKLAKNANVEVKAKLGNKLKYYTGGKFGKFMAIFGPIFVYLGDMNRIKTSFEESTGKGLAQLGVTSLKAAVTGGTYFFAEAFVKKGISAIMSKGATTIAAKCAGKLATKGLGKIIGTALGSLIPIPGVNLIAGILIGSLLDVGFRKLTAHITNPGDVVAQNKQTDEELLSSAYKSKLNGAETNKDIDKIFKKNTSFCANVESQMMQQQQVA